MAKPTKDAVPLKDTPVSTSRRQFLKKSAIAAAAAATVPSVFKKSLSAAGPRTIKIGMVVPRTGALAAFGEPDEWVLVNVRKAVANGIMVNGVNHPVEILYRDSMSRANRAGEVAAELIKSDNIDLMVTSNTDLTVNTVSDQCEVNGVPCVSNSTPWQVYYFGRGGTATKGFDWTYHFFWGLDQMVDVYTNMWTEITTNKIVGALWPNDAEGNTYSHPQQGFPGVIAAKGFKLADPGRFQPNTEDFAAQIAFFKKSNVDILTGVLPPPGFATFWSQAAQQGFRPKVVTFAKALLFPASVNSLGERGSLLSTEVWWSPGHPFKSGLTGQTAAQYAAQWEKETGKQWTQPLGFKHALLEVGIDVLKRSKNIDKPEAIRDAIRETNYNSIVGHVQWTGQPVKNVCRTCLVGGQWIPAASKFKYDLQVVSNLSERSIPVKGTLKPILYQS